MNLAVSLLLSTLAAQASPSEVSGPPQPTGTTVAPFIKGELAHAGSIRLIPKQSFLGIRLGFLLQDITLFMSVAPKADLEFLDRKLRVGLEAPLNFEFYDIEDAVDAGGAKGGFNHFGRLRKQDYDEVRDFVKFLRYLTYGRKEDHLFVNVGQLYATSLGHGTIMRRYAGNVDINRTAVGVEVNAYGDYGGFEFSLADITRGNLFGGLGFIKPLSFFSQDPVARSLSIGVTWATDQKAPLSLVRNPPIGSSPIGSIVVNDADIPETQNRAVSLIGVDAEVKFLKTRRIDLKAYADISFLNVGGNGVSMGVLGRYNFHDDSTIHLLRTRFELRSYSANYQPGYFDSLYEFQKVQYLLDAKSEDPNFSTKQAFISGRQGDRRFGLYLEASYSLPGWFVFAFAFETESGGQDEHLMLHTEVPLRFLDLFATYHQRNIGKLFSFTRNDVLFAGARLQILPVLFLNGRIQKSFVWDRDDYNGLGGYEEETRYQIDIEFGFKI